MHGAIGLVRAAVGSSGQLPRRTRAASGGTGGRSIRRGVGRIPVSGRRMGVGRAGKSRRCALPTTAFFETPIRRPISAVVWPSLQSRRSARMRSPVQTDPFRSCSSGLLLSSPLRPFPRGRPGRRRARAPMGARPTLARRRAGWQSLFQPAFLTSLHAASARAGPVSAARRDALSSPSPMSVPARFRAAHSGWKASR